MRNDLFFGPFSPDTFNLFYFHASIMGEKSSKKNQKYKNKNSKAYVTRLERLTFTNYNFYNWVS